MVRTLAIRLSDPFQAAFREGYYSGATVNPYPLNSHEWKQWEQGREWRMWDEAYYTSPKENYR